MFLAHITRTAGLRTEQTLKEHSRRTAEYAAQSVAGTGLGDAAYLAGLLHDMGKAKREYQTYLEDAFAGRKVTVGSVNHTFAGVKYLFERYHRLTPKIRNAKTRQTFACEVIACAIGAHHGEFDCVSADGEAENGFERRLDAQNTGYDEARANFFAECAGEDEVASLFDKAAAGLDAARRKILGYASALNGGQNKGTLANFGYGMLVRLLTSAVIYGDRRDTASFMSGREDIGRDGDAEIWESQLAHLGQKLGRFHPDTAVNAARAAISDRCAAAASRPCGVYRLNVPTGGGKTLASLRFALSHAAQSGYETPSGQSRGKRRVIFVMPLLSIIEQNAADIADSLADRSLLLEHDSDAVRPDAGKGELDRCELLTSDWHSPLIVTTLFQFLNTLFDGSTSSMRRMQALTDSVIVIDEIQMIPVKTLHMFCQAVNFLAYVCGCTVVLSSATQPPLEAAAFPIWFENGAGSADIVPYDEKLWNAFRRTEIVSGVDKYGLTLEQLAEKTSVLCGEAGSALVVCNTRDTALRLYRLVRDGRAADTDLYHLSAGMCMAHRKNVLDSVRASLAAGRGVICVSTQVVEAGIDFSFGAAIRVEAGLDHVIQTAGRCNRGGEYPDLRKVYIVRLKNGCEILGFLRDISREQSCMDSLLRRWQSAPGSLGGDLASEESISEYYKILYGEMSQDRENDIRNYPVKGGRSSLFEMLSLNKNNDCLNSRSRYGECRSWRELGYHLTQSFKTAGELFEVFDDDTVDAIVQYGREGEELARQIIDINDKTDYNQMEELYNKSKPYTVRLFRQQYGRLDAAGMILRSADGAFPVLKKEAYDDMTGVTRDI